MDPEHAALIHLCHSHWRLHVHVQLRGYVPSAPPTPLPACSCGFSGENLDSQIWLMHLSCTSSCICAAKHFSNALHDKDGCCIRPASSWPMWGTSCRGSHEHSNSVCSARLTQQVQAGAGVKFGTQQKNNLMLALQPQRHVKVQFTKPLTEALCTDTIVLLSCNVRHSACQPMYSVHLLHNTTSSRRIAR